MKLFCMVSKIIAFNNVMKVFSNVFIWELYFAFCVCSYHTLPIKFLSSSLYRKEKCDTYPKVSG